jgi:hypothetical protein
MPGTPLAQKLVELIQTPLTDENREQNTKDIQELFSVVKILSENSRLESATIDTNFTTRIYPYENDRSNRWDMDLLGLAIYYDNEAAVLGLLDIAKVPVDKPLGDVSALWMSVEFDRPHLTALFLQRGANVNFVSVNTNLQASPLHIATQKRKYDTASMLLLGGADTHLKREKQNTALATVQNETEGEGNRIKKLITSARQIHAAIDASKRVPLNMIAGEQAITTALVNDNLFTFNYLTHIANECAKASNEGGTLQASLYQPIVLKWALPKLVNFIDQGLLESLQQEGDEPQLIAILSLRDAIARYKVENALPKDQQIFVKPERAKSIIDTLSSAQLCLDEVRKQRAEAEAKAAEQKAAEEETRKATVRAQIDAVKAADTSFDAFGILNPPEGSYAAATKALGQASQTPPARRTALPVVETGEAAINAASYGQVFAPASPTTPAAASAAVVPPPLDVPSLAIPK